MRRGGEVWVDVLKRCSGVAKKPSSFQHCTLPRRVAPDWRAAHWECTRFNGSTSMRLDSNRSRRDGAQGQRGRWRAPVWGGAGAHRGDVVLGEGVGRVGDQQASLADGTCHAKAAALTQLPTPPGVEQRGARVEAHHRRR